MIVSASRRTDVPAFYGPWLEKRLEEGYVDVVNPFDARRTRRVSLRPAPVGDMEALVLWTRHPQPLVRTVRRWDEAGIRSLWLVTITGYPQTLEPAVPATDSAVEAFRALASVVGRERVVWRYDPVLLCQACGLTTDWHRRNFERLAGALQGATERCLVSLYDDYFKSRRRLARAGFKPEVEWPDQAPILELITFLQRTAESCGVELRSCCEKLPGAGIPEGACIDAGLLERIWGIRPNGARDHGQRPLCQCAPSVDIGAYDTCTHGCLYCYATGAPARAEARKRAHSPDGEKLVPDGAGRRSE